jgi:hypothetical protein
MKTRLWIPVGALIVAVVVILRWPRAGDPHVISVSCSEVSADGMTVEYRMCRPFMVLVKHRIRNKVQADAAIINVTSANPQRDVQVGLFPAKYDLIWGEYHARLHFRRGRSLTIECNDESTEIAPWSVPDAMAVKWRPPQTGVFGDGAGNDILYFAQSGSDEEYLIVYAGTGLKR